MSEPTTSPRSPHATGAVALARILPVIVALAGTGCGGCVDPGDPTGQEQPAAAQGSSSPAATTDPRLLRRPLRLARPPVSVLRVQPDAG
jgi:hypothetical protein